MANEERKIEENQVDRNKNNWFTEVAAFLFFVFFPIISLAVCIYFLIALFKWMYFWPSIILFVLLLFFLFLLYWLVIFLFFAPKDLIYCFPEEGMSKIVVIGKTFRKAILQMEGYKFSEDWTIEDGNPKKSLVNKWFGMRFVGIPIICRVYRYFLRWITVRQDGTIVNHSEWLNSVSHKDFVYGVFIDDVKEKNKIPLSIIATVRLRVINPYKALFRVHDWLEAIINVIKGLLLEYVGNKTYEELIASRTDIAREITSILGDRGWFETFKRDYGVEIRQEQVGQNVAEAIKIQFINPPDEYERQAAKERLAQFERERLAEITGGAFMSCVEKIIETMARVRNISIEEMKGLIKQNRDLQQDVSNRAFALLTRQILAEKNAAFEVFGVGDNPLEGAILRAISLITRGGSGSDNLSSSGDSNSS